MAKKSLRNGLFDLRAGPNYWMREIERHGGRFRDSGHFLLLLRKSSFPVDRNGEVINLDGLRKIIERNGYNPSVANTIALEQYDRLVEGAVSQRLKEILRELMNYKRVTGGFNLGTYWVEQMGLGRELMGVGHRSTSAVTGLADSGPRLEESSDWYRSLSEPGNSSSDGLTGQGTSKYDPFPYLYLAFSNFIDGIALRIKRLRGIGPDDNKS